MTGTFLNKILAAKRERVDRQLRAVGVDSMRLQALDMRQTLKEHRLREALEQTGSNKIIAEIKRSSPSKGVINDTIDVAGTASAYEAGGAAAISVLTEEDFFRGSLDDLIKARNAVKIPVLRKDFVVDEFQIFESAAAGADVILLIVAALHLGQLHRFLDIARSDLGMDVIVEVHTTQEFDIAASVNADIIGVNNRDLRTFDISLDISRDLIGKKTPGSLMVAESGISLRTEIDELRGLGFDGFLIGEALMRTDDPAEALKRWK